MYLFVKMLTKTTESFTSTSISVENISIIKLTNSSPEFYRQNLQDVIFTLTPIANPTFHAIRHHRGQNLFSVVITLKIKLVTFRISWISVSKTKSN